MTRGVEVRVLPGPVVYESEDGQPVAHMEGQVLEVSAAEAKALCSRAWPRRPSASGS